MQLGNLNPWIVYAIITTLVTFRYFLFAGIAYYLVWIRGKGRWQHRIIQGKLPDKDKLWQEFRYSMLTMLIFGGVGLGIHLGKKAGIFHIYKNIDDHGIGYFWFSVVALILLHDTYFYWTHRFMHWKKIFKYVHHVHHKSTNPSPWAAFSFHPTEAVIEAGIVPLVAFFMPLHSLAILVFLFYMTFLNVLGHLGFELFPKFFVRSSWTNWHNTTTHHNMHHKYFNCNYGLYFNWWDKWMGTNHKNYLEEFEKVTSNSRIPQKVSIN